MLRFSLWSKLTIVFLCFLGIIYALPNVFSPSERTYPLGFGQRINLGLDLQGGAHLLLEIDPAPVIKLRMADIVTRMRQILREQNIAVSALPKIDQRVQAIRVSLQKQADISSFEKEVRQSFPDLTVSSEKATVTVTMGEQALQNLYNTLAEQSIETVRRRVDESGTREPLIQRQGARRILVQLPGIDDPARVKELLGKTAQMTFQLVRSDVAVTDSRNLPTGVELLPATGEGNQGNVYVVEKRIYVSGDRLVDSQPSFQDNQPVVSFRFDSSGARKFGRVTTDNVGRLLAIVLDGEVISAPRIQGPILTGEGIITGDFSFEEASELSILLRAGALPAPMTVIEERTVGPGLGQDSIASGKIAIFAGFVLVVCFMIGLYRIFGVFASIALIMNVILIVALLSLLQATLTLPGIAGVLLTIGIAVDSNVLIFARIREEFANHANLIQACDNGFRQALTTILDANITTLMATGVLFFLGTGPVRGFAVTLGIGILASMFTAIMVTRAMIGWWLFRYKPQMLPFEVK